MGMLQLFTMNVFFFFSIILSACLLFIIVPSAASTDLNSQQEAAAFERAFGSTTGEEEKEKQSSHVAPSSSSSSQPAAASAAQDFHVLTAVQQTKLQECIWIRPNSPKDLANKDLFAAVRQLCLQRIMMDASDSATSTTTSSPPSNKNQVFSQSPEYLASPFRCPADATTEGIWGLNSRAYNSDGFLADERNVAPLGRWLVGPRSEFLPMLCRENETPATRNASTGQWRRSNATIFLFIGGSENNTVIRSTNITSSSSSSSNISSNQEMPRGAEMITECDWNVKPHGFTPFRGRYRMNTTVALYTTFERRMDVEAKHSLSEIRSNFSLEGKPFETAGWKKRFCYEFQSAQSCLRGKTIVFFGDSHLLNMAEVLCRMLLKEAPLLEQAIWIGRCGIFDVRFLKPMTVLHIPALNVTLAMLRVRYNLKEQMGRFQSHPWARYIERTADFVIYAAGFWHITYRDVPRHKLAVEMAESLVMLSRKFPQARIVHKMPHGIASHNWDWKCLSAQRVMEIRDANICASMIAQRDVAQHRASELKRLRHAVPELFLRWKKQQRQRQRKRAPGQRGTHEDPSSMLPDHFFDPYGRFSTFDVFGMTRELPYGNGTQGTGVADRLGHHFEGSIQESLVQILLNIFCPLNYHQQNYTAMFESFEREAKHSCNRLNSRASREREPQCGCADPSLSQFPEALESCKKFSKQWDIISAWET